MPRGMLAPSLKTSTPSLHLAQKSKAKSLAFSFCPFLTLGPVRALNQTRPNEKSKVQWTLPVRSEPAALANHGAFKQKTPQLSLRGFKVRMKGVEPPRLAALDPKSSVSTSSTTSAQGRQIYTHS